MAARPHVRPRLRPRVSRQQWCWRALGVFAVVLFTVASIAPRYTNAQTGPLLSFPAAPKSKSGGSLLARPAGTNEQMLVRANEINYDYANDRVSAAGNVQIYYSGTTLEADRVIYDQKTKRVHAEGNVRLSESNGRITYGEIINLSDDFRDGFVDSLRLDTPEQTRIAATRADRSAGNITVFHSGVYTACEPCADDPLRPPKWQVKAVRIIHDQADQMMYFENARLEFLGLPLAWLPFFSAPDPTAKRKTGFLPAHISVNSRFGVGITTPYYWALAPNYDFTLTPMFTTRQGPLVQGEWQHRLVNGAYSIRASGIWQLDPGAYAGTPGDRQFRGDINTVGQFRLSDKWVFGWDGSLITDKSYYQDYGFYKSANATDLLRTTPDHVRSQAYVQGAGARSFFDLRAIYFYGFTGVDDQRELPIVHPVVNHHYTFNQPVMGGEVSVRSNLTSLSRRSPDYEAITAIAFGDSRCILNSADPAVNALKNPTNCVLRGIPGDYTRASSEAQWRRTIVDSFGQMYTPFINIRGDIANVNVSSGPGVANFIDIGEQQVGRYMATAGVEYRYPFINVQSWGTQTIEPIAQILISPDENKIGALPNEDSQSFNFDASNLFRINKFTGWDRVEGGGRLNAGIKYTAQFNQGGYVNVLVGQSYHLFGLNSFTVGGTTNTGLDSGLDKARSDYVANITYYPHSQFALTSRFRFDESDLALKRSEFEAAINFERWSATVMYGNYAAQPILGFLNSREGIMATARYKLSANWLTFGGIAYDLKNNEINVTQIGVGYIDDCLILAMNYVTEFRYNTVDKYNHTVMLQVGLRTIGNIATRQGISDFSQNPTQGILR